MRIISKFKDYYDIHANAKDDVPVYIRETSTHLVRDLVLTHGSKTSPLGERLGPLLDWRKRAPEFGFRMGSNNLHRGSEVHSQVEWVILVSGQVYMVYSWVNWPHPYTAWQPKDPGSTVNPRDLLAIVMQHAAPDVQEKAETLWASDTVSARPDTHPSRGLSGRPLGPVFKASEVGFNAWGHEPLDLEAWHLHFQAPVLAIGARDVMHRDLTVHVNPCLREIAPTVAKLLPPTLAYQQIDLYLGSTLATQRDPVPERTQDLIRDAHGFDGKSFRKDADTRARKQRRST